MYILMLGDEYVFLSIVPPLIYVKHQLPQQGGFVQHVDPSGLSAFSACRLIASDKCPGVRPIGVGEVVRRIVGKVVLNIIGDEIQEVAGTSQVCAGQQAGCEPAVYAMTNIFEDPHMQAVILVDASNAFNNRNREVALRNILTPCFI